MSNIRIKVRDIAYHRNGISGDPVYFVLFDDESDEAMAVNQPMLATVFDIPEAQCPTAVISLPLATAGNIAFARGNSWRGDRYDGALREAITLWEKESR